MVSQQEVYLVGNGTLNQSPNIKNIMLTCSDVKAHPHRRDFHSSPWNFHLLLPSRLYELLSSCVFACRCLLISCLVPSTASWLSEKEKAFIQARLPTNAPRAAEANFSLRELIKTLRDLRVWLFLLCWAFYTVGTTGLQFYQPTVIANLGFRYVPNHPSLTNSDRH
jgi:hypothetical protein